MQSSFFQRLILPGFAFKAVVIGGGYATGRELVEFFLRSGPVGGLLALSVTTLLWSVVCALTFSFAYATRSFDYRSFFQHLVGRFWLAFEVAYIALLVLILSVFGAAAGEIAETAFELPAIAGMLALALGITAFAAFGNAGVEQLFKYVSIILYGTYALFVVLAVLAFGDKIAVNFATSPPAEGWIEGGVTYAGYNLVGAVVILPVVRHMASRRDAVISGLLCGPLAALPALLFFVVIAGFYPEIMDVALPSDFVLARLGFPLFHYGFQFMVFCALLESGTGLVHAINERLAAAHAVPAIGRTAVALGLSLFALFVASQVGLIALIAQGYRFSAYVFLTIFVLPLVAISLFAVVRRNRGATITRVQHRDYR